MAKTTRRPYLPMAKARGFTGASWWSKRFWRKTAERAIKTFAQTLAIILGGGAVDVLSVGWIQALSLAAGATLLSVLTSIGSAGVGDPASPSLVRE